MGITFRHDAAAVALPTTNASGRKYGQQLVLQQQQQKYATQQAQQDRMFDAYKMESQNIAQQQRDWQQRDFVLNRDRDQNKLQQQQMEAGRQQQFMDEARKMQNGMIMNDIQNGFYDQNTARELQQTIIAESEVLGTKYADATQRANALQQIRDRRAVLAANRLEKPPAPTEEERISSLPVMDGVKYGRDKDGNPVPVMVQDQETGEWKPYEKPSSSRSSGQKGAKGDPGASQRPVTFEEYWGADEDKFQSVLNAELQAMQDKFDLKPEVGAKAPTREDALNKMRDDYDFRQKALGKAQYGEPTPAKPYGQALEEARKAPGNEYFQLADMNDKLLELGNRARSFPEGSKERKEAFDAYRKERDRIINGDIQPAPEMRSILEQPGQQQIPATPMPGQPVPTAPSAPSPAQPAPSPPVAVTPPSPAQNALEQVATPPATPTPQATPQSPAPNDVDMGAVDSNGRIIPNNKTTTTKQKPPQSAKQPAAPDFGALAASAKDKTDRAMIDGMKGIYAQQPPEIQSAISVYLNPSSSKQDFNNALAIMLANGIDPDTMKPPVKGNWDAMKDTNRSLRGVR